MKKNDIIAIVLIASISVAIAFFVAKQIFGGVFSGSAIVKTIDPISADLPEPDPEVFNVSAINPTVRAVITGSDDQSIFGG